MPEGATVELFEALSTTRAMRRLKPDPVPAVQNLLLAARSFGLGATLTTLHHHHDPEIKRLLGIPNEVQTAALIPLGWPLGRFGKVERLPVEEVAFADRWGIPL